MQIELADLIRKRVAERGLASPKACITILIRSDDTDEWWALLSAEKRREVEVFDARIEKSLTTGGPSLTLGEARSLWPRQQSELEKGQYREQKGRF